MHKGTEPVPDETAMAHHCYMGFWPAPAAQLLHADDLRHTNIKETPLSMTVLAHGLPKDLNAGLDAREHVRHV